MHGDFSLNPTQYRDRVSRVLYQMGRVQLDSDANEQTEATLRFLRSLGSDIIGPHGGWGDSFKIEKNTDNRYILHHGIYYVDGIRCTHLPEGISEIRDVGEYVLSGLSLSDGEQLLDLPESFWEDPPFQGGGATRGGQYVFYLAVWERHVSTAENDTFREVALGGPDTASRAVLVWQIRWIDAEPVAELARTLDELLGSPNASPPEPSTIDSVYLALNVLLRSGGRMRARGKENQDTDPCVISPESMYRGHDNRLYRVEIHDGGDPLASPPRPATFKWSPDNASIVYPVRKIEGTLVKLESLGRDQRTALSKNDWVEVVDDEITLRRKVNRLHKVVDVDRHRMTVTLDREPDNNAGSDPELHPILRRWSGEPRPVRAAADATTFWEELSDGIEVQFSLRPPDGGQMPAPRFRTGDYWLVPARVATGNVIWPKDEAGLEAAIRPHGIDEHYAPLAAINANGVSRDLRWVFDMLAKPIPREARFIDGPRDGQTVIIKPIERTSAKK